MPDARRRSRTWLSTLAVIALAFPLTACGTDANGPSPNQTTVDPTLTEEFTPATPDTDTLPAPTFDSLAAVCTGTPVPGAVAYTGAGPHEVAFYDLPIQPDTFGSDDGVIAEEPSGWNGPPEDVQLVGCVAVSAGPVATTCEYGAIPEPMTMHWGEYTITLYRATTGAKVAVAKIQGSDDSCPATIAAPTGDNGPAPENSDFTSDQLDKALGSYIN